MRERLRDVRWGEHAVRALDLVAARRTRERPRVLGLGRLHRVQRIELLAVVLGLELALDHWRATRELARATALLRRSNGGARVLWLARLLLRELGAKARKLVDVCGAAELVVHRVRVPLRREVVGCERKVGADRDARRDGVVCDIEVARRERRADRCCVVVHAAAAAAAATDDRAMVGKAVLL